MKIVSSINKGTDSGAVFSDDGKYRYMLWRRWATGSNKDVCFIMLNPSTADHTADDPTIRRCVSFAKKWGFGMLTVVNLFAYRATNPDHIKKIPDPIGPKNDFYISHRTNMAHMVLCAWGNNGVFLNRDKQIKKLIKNKDTFCLGLTGNNQPRHPLYTRSDTELTQLIW